MESGWFGRRGSRRWVHEAVEGVRNVQHHALRILTSEPFLVTALLVGLQVASLIDTLA